MSDSSRSQLDDYDMFKYGSPRKYVDHLIPEGSVIAGGEVSFCPNVGMLYGIKFWD